MSEGDQKGRKYTCFARSALFTGNLYDLMHWFAIKSMISMTGGLTPPISENSHFSPQAGNKCQVTWCSHEGSDARGKSGYTRHFFYAVSCRYAHKPQHICAYEKKRMSTSDLLSDILNTQMRIWIQAWNMSYSVQPTSSFFYLYILPLC